MTARDGNDELHPCPTERPGRSHIRSIHLRVLPSSRAEKTALVGTIRPGRFHSSKKVNVSILQADPLPFRQDTQSTQVHTPEVSLPSSGISVS